MSETEQPGFFDPAPEDAARPVGLIEGPPRWHEGFGAGLRVWCGPLVGWRDFGDLIRDGAQGVIVRHERRLSVSLSFDLGEHVLPRAIRDRIAVEEAEEGSDG